jgi:hypothetical protein
MINIIDELQNTKHLFWKKDMRLIFRKKKRNKETILHEFTAVITWKQNLFIEINMWTAYLHRICNDWSLQLVKFPRLRIL